MTPANLRILVVSDRPAGRRVTDFLCEAGYSAINAAASLDGDIPADGDVDLILLDHLSDGFDSFPVYRILRRLTPQRPVLIVVLHMPPDYGELKEMVAWVLQEAKGEAQRVASDSPPPSMGSEEEQYPPTKAGFRSGEKEMKHGPTEGQDDSGDGRGPGNREGRV